MPDPVGELGLDPERLVHVERVRPGLHEPGGGHRGGRHRRPEPRDLLTVGYAAKAWSSAARAARQRASSSAGSTAPPASASASTYPSGSAIASITTASHAALSVAAMTATSSVQARWAICGGDVPAGGRGGGAPAVRAEGGDDGVERLPLDGEVGEDGGRGRSFMRSPCRAGVEGESPSGRGCGARRRVSSEMVVARPSPRTRSRVACTSSRTPGCDSSTPSALTVSRCASRPTRCSSGATAASRCSSVRAATHSSSAAVKTGEVKWSASTARTARVRRGPAGRLPTRGRQLGTPQVGEVLDRGQDQVVLGREVVQLSAAARRPRAR